MEKQEKPNIQYNRIKRKARTIPFGYKIDDTGNYLIPIESDALVNSEIPYAFESVSAVINKIKKCLIVLMLSLWC